MENRFPRARTPSEWKAITSMLDDAERNGQGRLARYLTFHSELTAAEIDNALRARGNDNFFMGARHEPVTTKPSAAAAESSKPPRDARYQRVDATIDAAVFASGLVKGRERLTLHLLRNTAMPAAEIISALAAASAASEPMHPAEPPVKADPWGDVIAKINDENSRAGCGPHVCVSPPPGYFNPFHAGGRPAPMASPILSSRARPLQRNWVAVRNPMHNS